MHRRKVAVIGGGLGGLSCAIRLARAGFEVDLFERSAKAGGKLAEEWIGPYRFDAGPTVVTLPEVFAELFCVAGEQIEDNLTFIPIDPLCTYYYPDGTRLKAYREPAAFASEVQRAVGEPPEHLLQFLEHSRRIHDAAAPMFLHRSLPSLGELLSVRGLRDLSRLPRADALRSMHSANLRAFSDKRMVQLFDRFATYNGSNPYRAPATLNLISAVEHLFGAYTVEGGIRKIADAITELAIRAGVRLHCSTSVERVRVDRSQATGIAIEGQNRRYDFVVSNTDVALLHRDLLGERESSRGSTHNSSSALVMLLAVAQRFPEIGLHSVFFSADYRREFTQIFDRHELPSDPTVYLHVSCKANASDAPPDGENWYLLVNAPPDSGQDWTALGDALLERAVRKVELSLGRQISNRIMASRIITPRDIELRSGSYRGSLYGPSSNNWNSAFKRHANRVRGVRFLYACGGSAHPGGGMPLAILSGKIAAELLVTDAEDNR